jgi:hypothetical protein
MRVKILFFILVGPFVLNAQVVNYDIQGVIKNSQKAKYAYLLGVSRQDTYKITPIIDGKFSFIDTVDLKGVSFYRTAYLVLSDRANITREEVNSQVNQSIGRSNQSPPILKKVVLEQTKLEIESPDKLNLAKVTSGGLLTIELEELEASKKNLKAFISKHPDSPLSISAVRNLYYSFRVPMEISVLEERMGSPKDLFSMLSERWRLSKEGVELKKNIDEIYSR